MSVQGDVRERGREHLEAAREGGMQRAEEGKGQLVQRLERVSGSVRRSAEALREDEPWLADLVEQGAGGVDEFARSMGGNDVGSIAGGIQRFARRNPAAFIGTAVAVGFVLGRVGRVAAHRQVGNAQSGTTLDRAEAGRGDDGSPEARPAARPPGTAGFERHHAASDEGHQVSGGMIRSQGPEAARSLRGQDSSATVPPAVGTLNEGHAEPQRHDPALHQGVKP